MDVGADLGLEATWPEAKQDRAENNAPLILSL
jgi:hypothetical protein